MTRFMRLQEPEYLIKWSGRAHIHNEWVRESQLLNMARRKLLNFKKRHGDTPVNFMEDEWLLAERFVARRPSPSNPGWEVLIKWQGQVCTVSVQHCIPIWTYAHTTSRAPSQVAAAVDGQHMQWPC
jgi:hypothetical protein